MECKKIYNIHVCKDHFASMLHDWGASSPPTPLIAFLDNKIPHNHYYGPLYVSGNICTNYFDGILFFWLVTELNFTNENKNYRAFLVVASP